MIDTRAMRLSPSQKMGVWISPIFSRIWLRTPKGSKILDHMTPTMTGESSTGMKTNVRTRRVKRVLLFRNSASPSPSRF